MFYWIAILFSQTLGTALGDWMADTNGLGYENGASVFGAGLAVAIVNLILAIAATTLVVALNPTPREISAPPGLSAGAVAA